VTFEGNMRLVKSSFSSLGRCNFKIYWISTAMRNTLQEKMGERQLGRENTN
jgi:hypothetical protein